MMGPSEPRAVPAAARRRGPRGGQVLLVALAGLLPALPFLVDVSAYALNILMQAITYSIAVLGLTVVLGYTGQISLAQAAFFGMGAYAVAIGTVSGGLNFWVSLLLGVATAAMAGAVLGLTTLRLGGHYLAMITISFQQIWDLVAVNWIPVTHGPDGIAGIPRPSLLGHVLAQDQVYLLVCMLILYGLAYFVWRLPDTRLGRAMRAVRENELAAEVVGVHTVAVKTASFVLSAMLAAVGGALYAGGFAYISPDNSSFGRSIEFLTMVMLGGAQSPVGSAIGTVLLILLPEWLRFLKQVYLAAYGVAVILLMIFLPEGLSGLATRLWQRLRPPSQTPAAAMLLALDVPPAQADAGPILRLHGVHKHFGGVRAVDGLDLEVGHGTVHALIGPNGSGKTTLLNVLSGIYRPTHGRLVIDGVDVGTMPPHDRAALGVGRTFQNIRLFPALSALENVMIGAQRRHNPVGTGTGALCGRALSALQFVGLGDRAADIARQLPYGHQRLVEIARAIAGRPKLLFLDEPAAGLNQTEKQQLVALLERLRGHGLTLVLIDHDVRLVEQISDTITVLNFGRKIAEGSPAEVLRHPDVIAAYLGDSRAGPAA